MPERPHRPPTEAAHTAQVRELLLQSAADLIPRHGWGSVSTRMIAEQAGVTAGLVHYHFGSVQALLADAAVGRIRTVVAGMGAMLADARSAQQVLTMLFGALDTYSGHDPFSLLMAETYLAAGRDDRLREKLTAVVTEFRDDLESALRAHRVSDPGRTAAVLAAAMDGIVLHRALGLPLPASTVTRVLSRTLQESEADA